MKVSKYLYYMLRDFVIAYGVLFIVVAGISMINSNDFFSVGMLLQVGLGAAGFTFARYSLVNKYTLEAKVQRISFFICYVLADLMVVLWLFIFSPGKVLNNELLIIYIIIILLVKGAVSWMMYLDGRTQAKQLNEGINRYKKGN
jgi:hypothetical protein